MAKLPKYDIAVEISQHELCQLIELCSAQMAKLQWSMERDNNTAQEFLTRALRMTDLVTVLKKHSQKGS